MGNAIRSGMEAAAAERFLGQVVGWARSRKDVLGVLLVGSWARGSARAGSDLDLVLLAEDPGAFRRESAWVGEVGLEPAVAGWEDGDYGAVWSRHVRLEDGSRLELSFAARDWASTLPPDAGTAAVVGNGCRVLYDPEGLLEQLVRQVENAQFHAEGGGP